MDDYISREAAIKALRKRQCEGCPAFPKFCEACKTNGNKQEIIKIPAADVRPVVRGEWIWELADNGWANHICSCCGYTKNTDIHVALGWNFCPNCGADMREEGSNG